MAIAKGKSRLTISPLILACAVALMPARAPRALAQTAPAAPGARYAVLVQGVSGDDEYAVQHRKWLDGMVGALRQKLGFDAAHVIVLAEKPGAGEQLSNAANVTAVLGRLAKQLEPADLLFVMLIGHGSGEGPDAKFNLVGPDLSVPEWNALLKPIQGRLVFVDATSSSFPFLAGLDGPDRVIITATSKYSQKYHTMFADGFISAFTGDAADTDHNGRVSIWEAFAYATRQVAQYYDQAGYMATESAVLDDTGKGVGRDGSAANQGGSIAGLTYLDVVAAPASSDPALLALLERQRALTDQIDELRRRRSTMAPADFDQAFEKLIVDLSLVSRDIRRKSSGR